MDAPTHACAICRKPASSVCAGCVEGTDIASINHRPARYCGEDCQKADWPSHQQSCQAVQAKIKLFRAGQILQECFLATRAAASDVCASRVEREGDGTIHFYNQRADRVRPLLLDLAKTIEMRNAVLSYGASGEVFAGLMFELGKRAFRGKSLMLECNNSDFADRPCRQATLSKSRRWTCECSGRVSRHIVTATALTSHRYHSTSIFTASCVSLSKT